MEFLNNSKAYEKEFLADLKALVAIPSLEDLAVAKPNAPFGPEVRKALDYMLELGREAGFEVRDYEGYAGTITYGEGSESVGILGHLDIVPLGEGWSKDPLGCEIRDGYIFGRGVSDDKGPTLAAFYAMKILKDMNVKPKKKIILIVGCNEETGMACMEYYNKHGEIPTCGFTPDASFPVIYGEKGIFNFDLVSDAKTKIKSLHAGERQNIVIGRAQVKVAKLTDCERKRFYYYLSLFSLKGKIESLGEDDELEIEGTYFHSAQCYHGVNAALHLLNFIGNTLDDQMAKDLYHLLGDWKGSAMNIGVEGAYMGFLTMNTGIVNIEDNKTKVVIDIRYPNETDGAELTHAIEAAVKLVKTPFKVLNISNSKPLFVDPNSELVKTLQTSYRKYSKDEFTPAQTIGGGTYARKFKNFVAFGAEFPLSKKPDFFIGGPHEKDEAVKIEELILSIAIYTDAIKELSK